MSEMVFKGRPLLPGKIEGEVLVTRRGFNSLPSYLKRVMKGFGKATCSDQDNPDLYRKVLADKILCLPKTIGSTIGGLGLLTVAEMGIAPRAFLFSETIDSLAAGGLVLTEVWLGRRIVTVDRLGANFLASIKEGMTVIVEEDGTVRVMS